MSNRRVSMRKIREILRLKEKSGLSNRQISRSLKVSRPVVSQYLADLNTSGLHYEDIEKMSDSELLSILEKSKERLSGKYKVLSGKFEYIQKELLKTGVTLMKLWEEYRQEYPDGYGYSQYCHHFQVWRKTSKIYMHIEHKAGDKMFVDYAGKKLTIYDRYTGEPRREVSVFVAVLGASQMIYSEPTLTQRQRDWITANENALRYFGGVPRAIVPDCLKTGVTKASKYEPELNRVYLDFAEYYDTAIVPARPNSPRDKALAEIAVQLVYQRIFAPLRNKKFYSLEELKAAFFKELQKLNNRFFQRTKLSRRSLFNEVEKEVLKPLSSKKYEYKDFLSTGVQFNYHVELREDRHYYSVPYQLKGQQVQVFYTAKTVEIYHNNERVAFHLRDYRKLGYTTSKQHMPPEHKFYDSWSPKKFISWARNIGEHTEELVREVLESKKYPEQAFKSCLGILNFTKTHGNQRLEKACRRAVEFKTFSYPSVKNILKKGLDKIEESPWRDDFPRHGNIRGAGYYAPQEESNG